MATSAQLRKQILQGSWDDALAALYGADPAVLQRQRGRYAAALEQFELYFGPGRQVQMYSAPGRAELGGNHTDHQGGYGLAAAVTLDLVAVAARNTDGYVRVKSRGFNKLDVIDLATAEPQAGESTHSASLIRGIAEGFRAAGKQIGMAGALGKHHIENTAIFSADSVMVCGCHKKKHSCRDRVTYPVNFIIARTLYHIFQLVKFVPMKRRKTIQSLFDRRKNSVLYKFRRRIFSQFSHLFSLFYKKS